VPRWRELGALAPIYKVGDLVDFAAPGGGRFAGIARDGCDDTCVVRLQSPAGRPAAAIRSQISAYFFTCFTQNDAASKEVMDTEILAQPRGFCAGVDRAIEIVERALSEFGAPIYVRHEIVHNAYVVEDLRNKGAIFIEELDDVPAGNTLVFSAHGVSEIGARRSASARPERFRRNLPAGHQSPRGSGQDAQAGREIVMIGHDGHPEVEGTMGQTEEGMHLVETVDDVKNLQVKNGDLLSYVTQTTLSVDDTADVIAALKERFPNITEPKKGDICYATTNRQEAVKFMAPQVELVIVVGSPNSSNSNRLREVAEKMGVHAYMVDNAIANRSCLAAGQTSNWRDSWRIGT
jgi:4-hydroxy-3-methylbut-2-enyl diphosphate reductase